MTTPNSANSGADVDVNPAGAVRRRARVAPDHVVVRYEGGDLSYAGLDERAARLAAVLAEGGVGEGERVAYLGLNSSSFLVTMLAAFRLGAVFVPLNFRLTGVETGYVLGRSGAVALVCEDGHRAVAEAAREGVDLRLALLVDDDPAIPVQGEPGPAWAPWSGPLAEADPHPEIASRGFADPAILMFTSGTTGRPKGVLLTHGNVWWNSVNVDTMLDTRRGDTTHAVAPLFHIGALNSFVIRTLVRGGTVIVRRTFDPASTLADLTAHRVNSTFMVPAMLAGLSRVEGIAEADLSALRSVVVAGAPVPPSLIEQFAGYGVLLQQAWGLTETAPFATHLPAESTMAKLGSAGLPMPHTRVRVVDTETGEAAAPGVAGEVLVSGPNVTPGYWENPEATAAAFDAEGWFHSGDIGYLDEDGYLFIVDRLKDMIISGGENVYPAEVERVLTELPGLTDIAVIGVGDERWGERVVAVVSLAEGVELTLEELRAFGERRLARYKLPRELRVVPALPRNASGKLEKVAVRAMVG
ncbi:fatty-acyl-CoA synthase [Actinocorallia herbida]|uniref:Fatty-acyl-CoA synthase n=1 Tax=Actinocorallia herbida TaxID=58109 RepID=A0A3N1D6C5_9ACTN|nr:long-chain fatty acid--CoA ligase [Actinocorallia herbida]ROO89087.1 fatty-acyl-CoA synthase [Actinocorallia herbida]